jgi:hypothetical protein
MQLRFSIAKLMGLVFLAAVAFALVPLSHPIWFFVLLAVYCVGIGFAIYWAVWRDRKSRVFGILALVLLLLAPLLLMNSYWVGNRKMSLQFVVIDNQTNQPLTGATVRILNPEDPRPDYGNLTGPGGKTKLTKEFWAAGHKNVFRTSGYVSFRSRFVQVSAPGYHTFRRPLSQLTREPLNLHHAPPPPITVSLRQMSPYHGSGGPLAAIEGDYFSCVHAIRCQTIEVRSDGTSSLVEEDEFGLSSTILGTAEMRAGSLWLIGQEEEAGAKSPELASEFIPVRWDDRIYLVPKDRVSDFRREINEGREPRNRAFGTFLLREGDWEKPVTGRPQLPAE